MTLIKQTALEEIFRRVSNKIIADKINKEKEKSEIIEEIGKAESKLTKIMTTEEAKTLRITVVYVEKYQEALYQIPLNYQGNTLFLYWKDREMIITSVVAEQVIREWVEKSKIYQDNYYSFKRNDNYWEIIAASEIGYKELCISIYNWNKITQPQRYYIEADRPINQIPISQDNWYKITKDKEVIIDITHADYPIYRENKIGLKKVVYVTPEESIKRELEYIMPDINIEVIPILTPEEIKIVESIYKVCIKNKDDQRIKEIKKLAKANPELKIDDISTSNKAA